MTRSRFGSSCLMAFVGWAAGQGRLAWQRFALGPWLRNVFAPMYGQRDWQSRIISFFARIVIIATRLAGYIAYLFVLATLCLGWIVLPPAIGVLLVLQLSHLGA